MREIFIIKQGDPLYYDLLRFLLEGELYSSCLEVWYSEAGPAFFNLN